MWFRQYVSEYREVNLRLVLSMARHVTHTHKTTYTCVCCQVVATSVDGIRGRHTTDRSTVRVRGQLKCDGTRAETRFCLSAKRTSPVKSPGALVQSTTGSRGVRMSGSNAGYTVFRGSVKGTGYTFHSPVSPSLPHPCAIIFQMESSSNVSGLKTLWLPHHRQIDNTSYVLVMEQELVW